MMNKEVNGSGQGPVKKSITLFDWQLNYYYSTNKTKPFKYSPSG